MKEINYKGPNNIWFYLDEMSRIDKYIETKIRLVVLEAGGKEEYGEWLLNGQWGFFGGCLKCWKLGSSNCCTSLRMYEKTPCVYTKGVNFMVYELYLKTAIKINMTY